MKRIASTANFSPFANADASTWLRFGRRLPWLALVVSLAVTRQLWKTTQRDAAQELQTYFDFRVREANSRIEQRMMAYEQVLQGAKGLFAASTDVERDEFRAYVSSLRLEQNYPGIQGVGFSLIVPAARKEEHIAALRKKGFPAYVIWPEGERELYTSIIYLEPFVDRNLRAFGYDMYSEPVRRAAMEQARDADRAALSGKVKLAQETEERVQAGFLMYLPVYQNGAARDTLANRRANLIGWVYAPFRINDLMTGLQGENAAELRIEIYDGEKISDKTRMYDSHDSPDLPSNARFQTVHRLKIAGRPWTAAIRSLPAFEARQNQDRPWFIAYAGIGASLLLALTLNSLMAGRFRAERLIRARTAALEESESRLRIILNSLQSGVLIIDEETHTIVDVNPVAVRLIGKPRDKIIGSVCHRHVCPSEKGKCPITDLGQMMDNSKRALLRADGAQIPIIKTVTSIVLGGRKHLLENFTDITELKKAEDALRESKENFHTFFHTMDDIIVVATLDGKIIYSNPAMSRKLGYSPEEIETMHVLDLHPADKRQEAEAILAAMLRRERGSCPLQLAAKNGAQIPVETRVWFGQWSGMDCIFGVCKDLSQQEEALQKFNRLFNNNPALMAVSNMPDRKFSDVNDAFLSKLGFSRAEVIGKTSQELGLFAEPERQEAMAEELRKRNRITNYELKVKAKDGAILDGLFSGVIIDNQGRQSFLTVMIDLTEQKKAEAAVRASEERLSRIIEGTHVGTWEWDVQTGEAVFNKRWADILGYTLAELAPVNIQTWRDRAHPDDLRKSEEQIEKHFAGELPYYDIECRMKRRNGGWVWVHNRGKVIEWTEDGKPRRMAGTNADITERKRLEADLLAAKQAADTANRAKSAFLANMSHEIRTPMNAILGFSQLMIRDPALTPVQQKRLQTINRSGEHLLELINDILEISKIEVGRVTLNPTPFDLNGLLADLEMTFRMRAEEKHLQLLVERMGDMPRRVICDEGKLRQVFFNLLSNAIKFTEKGGISLRIGVRTKNTGELRLKAEVEDTGVGIAEEETDKLFKPFEQTKSGLKVQTGTGLGLAISREFVRLMGGDISVSSQIDKGSIFGFEIDLQEGQAESGVKKPDPRRVIGLQPGQSTRHVLLADDKESNRTLLSEILRILGFEVREAVDGRQAVHEFEIWRPQLILMDMRMPVMNGGEAIRRIRTSADGHKVKIIALTASVFEENRREALACGADDFLGKPFRETELFEKIKVLLGIEYVYEEPEAEARRSEESVPIELTAEKLAALPSDLVARMREATVHGDYIFLLGLNEQVAAHDARVAQDLRGLIERFDYDHLLALFHQGGAS